ncbi:MAG: tetratricopeptide repeat protein [Actinomycetales bacterium]
MSTLESQDDLAHVDTLMERGRLGEAILLLERLAFADPANGPVWRRLTIALLETGQFERAAITSCAYEAMAPSPHAYLLRSRALLQVEPHEALAPALSAQVSAPQDWATHAQVARCHVAGPDHRGHGLQAAQQAVELAPGQAEAHVVLALALRRHDRLPEAESAAGRALSLDPRNTEAKDVLEGLALRMPSRREHQATARAGRRQAGAQGHVDSRAGLLFLLALVVIAVLPVTVLVAGGLNPLVQAGVCLGLAVLLMAALPQWRQERARR